MYDYLFVRNRSERMTDLSSPPGYSSSIGNNQIETAREADSAHLIIKKSWDLALGPIRQVRYSVSFLLVNTRVSKDARSEIREFS